MHLYISSHLYVHVMHFVIFQEAYRFLFFPQRLCMRRPRHKAGATDWAKGQVGGILLNSFLALSVYLSVYLQLILNIMNWQQTYPYPPTEYQNYYHCTSLICYIKIDKQQILFFSNISSKEKIGCFVNDLTTLSKLGLVLVFKFDNIFVHLVPEFIIMSWSCIRFFLFISVGSCVLVMCTCAEHWCVCVCVCVRVRVCVCVCAHVVLLSCAVSMHDQFEIYFMPKFPATLEIF